jgi:hypothetical protein
MRSGEPALSEVEGNLLFRRQRANLRKRIAWRKRVGVELVQAVKTKESFGISPPFLSNP